MILSASPRRVTAVCGQALLVVISLCSLGGCAPQSPGSVTLAAGDRTFDQTFAAAYYSNALGGDSDIVLLDRAAKAALDGHPNNDPVRQVMRIRVLWNATRELKADHTSASNATLHWYVLGNTAETASDVIEYSGTAMAVLESDGNQTLCSVRGASMRMVARRGTLYDPIGKASLTGTIRAKSDAPRARQALAEVRSTIITDAIHFDPTLRPALPEKTSSLAQ